MGPSLKKPGVKCSSLAANGDRHSRPPKLAKYWRNIYLFFFIYLLIFILFSRILYMPTDVFAGYENGSYIPHEQAFLQYESAYPPPTHSQDTQ